MALAGQVEIIPGETPCARCGHRASFHEFVADDQHVIVSHPDARFACIECRCPNFVLVKEVTVDG